MKNGALFKSVLVSLVFIAVAIITSSFFLLSTGLYQPVAAANIEAIKENFREQEKCWTAADIDCYCQAYAPIDSVKMIHSGGVVNGKENIIAFYKTHWNASNMGRLYFDKIDISKLGKHHYFVTGRYNLERAQGKASGHFSVVMVKYKGQWKILSDHSS